MDNYFVIYNHSNIVNTVGERLRSFLDKKKIPHKKITTLTGIRKENISLWLSGEKTIPLKHVQSILQAYKDLDARWFITGEPGTETIAEVSDPVQPFVLKCSLCAEKDERIKELKDHIATLKGEAKKESSDGDRKKVG